MERVFEMGCNRLTFSYMCFRNEVQNLLKKCSLTYCFWKNDGFENQCNLLTDSGLRKGTTQSADPVKRRIETANVLLMVLMDIVEKL